MADPCLNVEEALPRLEFSSASSTVVICAGSVGANFAILKEDGFAILLETGGKLLQE